MGAGLFFCMGGGNCEFSITNLQLRIFNYELRRGELRVLMVICILPIILQISSASFSKLAASSSGK